MDRPRLYLDGFEPALATRIRQTVACPDSDAIHKVEGAGEDRVVDGTTVQIMHNGLMVERGGYFGDWMAEIIRALRGHHEPQEELVFHHVIERLKADTASPTMIELGSFWLYYGLWFLTAFEGDARVVAIEPDPVYLQVGVRNAALNGLSYRVTFVAGAIGAEPGAVLEFPSQGGGGELHAMKAYDLASLMAETGLDHVDIVMCDIQGAESILLDRARGDFAAGKVRFLIVSSHHNSISGDPLTHQRSLQLLQEAGAYVLAEHGVSESCSGDGLIAVSFDPRDADLTVPVSHVRSKDSLFGELEYELAAAMGQATAALGQATAAMGQASAATSEVAARDATVAALESDLARLTAAADHATIERDRAVAELDAIRATKSWRALKVPREVYRRVRR